MVGVGHCPLALQTSAAVTFPAEQDFAAPHDVPCGLLAPATQTWEPVAHENDPVLQTSVGWHAPPAVHAEQVPSRHTWLLPQVVPFATFVLLSVQTGAPVAQVRVPLWHGFAGAHDAPLLHMPQVPFEHT